MCKNNEINLLMQCPVCQGNDISSSDTNYFCEKCQTRFPVFNNVPIMINDSNSLFKTSEYLKEGVKSDLSASFKGNFFVPSLSTNFSFNRIMLDLKNRLNLDVPANILVIGAGLQANKISLILNKSNKHNLVFTDVDIAANINIICDAHNLPFKNDKFDAVITTAVLEHVIQPDIVVSEIVRVLRQDGYIYSEIPFIQQVHEGAYDFTRYTATGHRRLFNRFNEIEVGIVAGPGTSLAWTLENFFLSLIPANFLYFRKFFKIITRFSFFWLKYFDYYFINIKECIDSASCTFFYGTKAKSAISDDMIISRYEGAKKFRHL
jgi:SAM-dependent methyltransferase